MAKTLTIQLAEARAEIAHLKALIVERSRECIVLRDRLAVATAPVALTKPQWLVEAEKRRAACLGARA